MSNENQAVKYDSKKPDLSLVPPSLNEYAAEAFMFGENKYGRWNWTHGFEWHRLISSTLRHMNEFIKRKDKDNESGLHPLKHAAASLAMLIDHVENNLGTDDRRD